MSDSGCLWLIGGTQESLRLAQAIAVEKIPCVVTVTTADAERHYPKGSSVTVRVGPLTAAELPGFLKRYQIRAIVDASHPFAQAVSVSAQAITVEVNLPYLRYERPCLAADDHSLELESVQTLVDGDYLRGKRVLLTLGAKSLPYFAPWQEKSTLFARILPTPSSLALALASGFSGDRLIALRPPIAEDLEKALWQLWQISLVVTKASGLPGGEAVKRQLAKELGISLICIRRPAITYLEQTEDLETVLAFCRRYF